jgi:ankyrin repeat protein
MLANIFEISLSEHAKKINEAFYLKPFQGKPQAKANLYSLPVERVSHGAQHAARVAIYVRILINFFRAKGYPEALILTEEDIFLLQIAALMHDVSRFDDRSADTTAELSAQHCYFYFRSHGISEERSRYFSDLILQKENGGFLGEILQASDSLDIMRCKKVFYVDQLAILTLLQTEHRGFLFTLIDEIGQLIASQYDMKEDVIVSSQGQIIYRYQKTRDPSRPELKGSYEHSENCYLKICAEIDSYTMLSMYFHEDSLLQLANSGSEISPTGGVTRKRKFNELEEPEESRECNLDVMLLTEELENELLPKTNCSDLVNLNQVEEKTSEPALKKAKQEEIKSEAYLCGYNNGINRIEKTRNPFKNISVPKKYVKKQDKEDYCLGYKEGFDFITKSLAEDKAIFYNMGVEAGKKDALEFYRPRDNEFIRYQAPDLVGQFKMIYGHYSKTILEQIYKEGYDLTCNYYICLLNNYYKNYIQTFRATIRGKSTEKAIIVEHKQQELLTPEQLEHLNMQALAGHKEGIEFANEVIAENGQKDHFAFFRLQIKRLTKLYEEGTVNWERQASFVAALHPKAWENRGYILRNHFCPPKNSISISSSLNFGILRRVFSYTYSSKEEATAHFVFFQLLLPFHLELLQRGDEAKPIYYFELNDSSNQWLLDLRCVDSLAKSVRWDDNIFLGNFLSSITKSPENQFEEKLRKGPHKKYTVYAHGFFERSQKVSPYNLPSHVLKEKKKQTSRHQSTSLVREKEPIFGHGRRQKKLVGFIFKPLKDLINRIFIYDTGTINRPYEFDTAEGAKSYFTRSVNHHPKTLFKTLQELKDNTVNNTKNYNEVLARLKWDINTSSVGIFSDTFEARCIAQYYAKLTYQRLLCQYRELGLTLPQDYQVPIVFYLPGSDLNWQVYSAEQQANDKIKAEKIFSDEAAIKNAFDQGNFEFLLLLGDLEHLSYLQIPVIFWVAHICSMNIAKVLYEQTNMSFLVVFEEYLSDTLQKLWRVEKECLSAWKRNICVDMALNLGLKDLVKEILKTKLVDENNSDKYGNFLFTLVEHGEFQLLTEIVTNQTIDLDQTNKAGDTLLHVVAKANQLMLVQLLIEKGANMSIKNKDGETPLAACIQKQIDNSDMIHLLLWCRSGDPAIFQSEKRAMFKACIILNHHAVKVFIHFFKEFLWLKNSDDMNLLHIVILSSAQNSSDREAKLEIVRLLLQNGANPLGLYQGQTSLELARQKGLLDIVKEITAYMGHSPSIAK